MRLTDERYILQALILAENGRGSVEPNPIVGAVIVKDDEIIGRGYHEKFGGPHAEINALADCAKNNISPAGATMYVTLEPCCHIGKTGPCTDAIIKAKLARVIIAMTDPTAKVSGKGIEQLQRAGVAVDVGLCQKQARKLNAPFVKFAETKKPWVIVKWAQSQDGFLARNDGVQWISGEESRKDVHKLRRQVQGILVGINTVLADDPLLTARPGREKQPTRIVLDSKLRIPLDCKLFATIKEAGVLVCTTEQGYKNSEKVAEIRTVGGDVFETCDLKKVLEYLGSIGIQQLLVEGGAGVIDSFLSQALADEAVVYIAPVVLGKKGKVPISESMAECKLSLGEENIKKLGQDKRIIFKGTIVMNKREVIKLALKGKDVPYVPWHCGFTVEALGKLEKHFGTTEIDKAIGNHIIWLGRPEGIFEDIGNAHVRDYFGIVWDRSVDKDIGIVEGTVLTAPSLKGYEFPDPKASFIFKDVEANIAANNECFRVFPLGFSLYERAWTLRGMENLMMDFIENPDFVKELLKAIADYNIAHIKEAVRYDIDAIYFGDDWGQQHGLQMGPEIWREFIKPELTRMYAAVKDAGKYVFIHSCGKVDELFDDLIDIGLDCFNPFQPEVMDVFALMKKYRSRLAFHGGLSTQKTLPYGSVEDVKNETEKLLQTGRAGGYIFAPAHAVEGDVPLENMLAFINLLKCQNK